MTHPSPPERPDGDDPEPLIGWIADDVATEFPELRLVSVELPVVPTSRSPAGVRHRLRLLSDRFAGAQAINLRRTPVPAAYRVFFHQIGLDPDDTRTPIEQAVLERMLHGAFVPRSWVDDALLIALVETGVGLWALDATNVHGPLGIRLSGGGERLGRSDAAPRLPAGRMVVADADSALAVLFGDLAPTHGVSSRTRRMTAFAVLVAGVPMIHAEEAMWTLASLLQGT